MEALWLEHNPLNLAGQNWSRMFFLSLVLHLALFSIIFFVPEPMPTRRIRGIVYEVNLVEIPAGARVKPASSGKSGKVVRIPGPRRSSPAHRIRQPDTKKKPVVIAKRTLRKKGRPAPKPKTAPSKLLDRALARIEKRIREEKKDPVGDAISKLEAKAKAKGPEGETPTGAVARNGISMRIYQMEVENWIKSNWSYPTALSGSKKKKALETVVILKVRNDGKILKSWFQKRSSNAMFDQSVFKAVDRSDPLPPFPQGYRKTHDEIEITFNLRDLEDD
jgi:colicin import membrane protein